MREEVGVGRRHQNWGQAEAFDPVGVGGGWHRGRAEVPDPGEERRWCADVGVGGRRRWHHQRREEEGGEAAALAQEEGGGAATPTVEEGEGEEGGVGGGAQLWG